MLRKLSELEATLKEKTLKIANQNKTIAELNLKRDGCKLTRDLHNKVINNLQTSFTTMNEKNIFANEKNLTADKIP